MSANTSPAKSDISDILHSDANFNADINTKMRVSHKISFRDPENVIMNGESAGWKTGNFNINMQVPERILVAGQHQHIGTRAPPREIVLDNSIMPKESETLEIFTPPRVITLDKYSFPVVVTDKPEDKNKEMEVVQNQKYDMDTNDIQVFQRDSTPPLTLDAKLSAAEEIHHLRRQMAKLHRRVVALELENLNRMQKEKIIYGIGIAYFLLKAIMWLRRS